MASLSGVPEVFDESYWESVLSSMGIAQGGVEPEERSYYLDIPEEELESLVQEWRYLEAA